MYRQVAEFLHWILEIKDGNYDTINAQTSQENG